MKKFILTLVLFLIFIQPSYSGSMLANLKNLNDVRQVRKVLNSQVRWANKTNFKKFISTYDDNYKNSDGFDLEIYSKLVKDIWSTYDKVQYGIKIKNISVNGEEAKAELTETSNANIPLPETSYDGELKSRSESIYYFKKTDGKWKVISDDVIDETTTMMYGKAKELDIKLIVPEKIEADTEYTATLEFIPPEDTMAIASLASDIVEYPQKPTQEVFRAMPEDHILERLFTSNNKNANEYIVASIGLTQTSICDLSIKLSLTGFGYKIKRVNVIPANNTEKENINAENK